MKTTLYTKRRLFITALGGFIPFVTFIIIGIILLLMKYNISAIITFVISMIGPLLIIWEFKNGIITSEIIIDQNGLTVIVKEKQVTIEWKEVKYFFYSKHRSIKYVSVYTSKFGGLYGTNREYYDNCVTPNYKPNKGYIFFEYREEIMNEIMKYCTGKIINEDMFKRK